MIAGGYSSAICLAAAQAAARYGIAFVVDLGAADSIVERGLGNTFRFGPGHRVVVPQALFQLRAVNSAAGDPAGSVMIVHEVSRLGTAMSGVLTSELPALGFEAVDIAAHSSGARDFGPIVSRIKAAQPDVLIVKSGYDESARCCRSAATRRLPSAARSGRVARAHADPLAAV